MKRPLVAVVSCYATGLLFAEIFQPPLVALLGTAFALLVLILVPWHDEVQRRRLVLEKFRPLLIWPLLALVGWTNLAGRIAVVSPNDLRTLLGDTSAIVTVRGTLIETPHLRITESGDRQTERSVAQVQVTAVRRNAGWQPACGSIVVTTPGALAVDFFAGQPVEISGVIGQPPPPLAEGLFDYRDYLQTRGIYYQLKTSSTDDWQLGAAPLIKPPLTDRFLNWSRRTLALGLPVEDEPLHLLWAMTLGWRTALTADISEPFLRAGTMHLFAIDGLRIALISGMLVALLRVLQISGVVRHRGDSSHLVLHRRDRLGILRHPRLGDDDHRHRRLGVETSG
jgi:competence protein ComEC